MNVGSNGIVVNEFNEVLLIQRDDTRTWAMPGGSLDPGELPDQGAAREVEEETGLKVLPVRLVGLDFWPHQPQGFLIFSFRCLVRGGSLAPSAEALQVGFYPSQRLPGPMLALHRQRLGLALNHHGGPITWRKIPLTLSHRLGRFMLFNVVYPFKNWRRRWRRQPPYVEPLSWQMGAFTVIRDENGRVLWIRRRDKDVWNLPGGGQEGMEAPWETAVRETHEESGLAVRLVDLSGVYVKAPLNRMLFTFTAATTGGRLTTGPEAAEFAYFTPGEEPANSLPNHVERVRDAVNANEYTVFRRQGETPVVQK
jgi:ADP-ribose pyrophosphatase YjhB (NUDIX family)